MTTKTTIEVPCSKCDGKGRINGFGHIERGICFRCNGSKTFTVDAAKHAQDVANALAGAAFYKVECTLAAWSGGYGAVEEVAAAILADGGDCTGIVGFYLRDNSAMRAELTAAYKAARSAAKAASAKVAA